MDKFTCISCRIALKDGETQRLHYKTDWHRYNLKRKVAELPPVTFEDFQARADSSIINTTTSNDKSAHCSICKKNFASRNAFDNHLNSKKHKENCVKDSIKPNSSHTSILRDRKFSSIDEEAEYETDSEVEEVSSDEWEDDVPEISDDKCLFCAFTDESLLKRIEHMSIAHSFFIPDVEYCSDIEGLLHYLAEKINHHFMCIWCNESGRTFYSAEAAMSHMIDKGHCKILHEGGSVLEYASYYDYSSSYPDDDPNIDKDSEVPVSELDDSDYQLVLPSGTVIGHRSLLRYYKQSFPSDRAVIPRNSTRLQKMLCTFRALGWSSTQQETATRKARDLQYMRRLYSKNNLKLGVKNNKLQKFVRQINL